MTQRLKVCESERSITHKLHSEKHRPNTIKDFRKSVLECCSQNREEDLPILVVYSGQQLEQAGIGLTEHMRFPEWPNITH